MPRTGTDAWGKEQHFFNRFAISSDLASYESVFVDSEKPDALIAGEITPAYAILPRHLVRTIANYLPPSRTRILFVVRNPVDRLISAYKQFHFVKGRSRGTTPHARAWRFISYAERPGVVRRTDYGATLRTWAAEYGRERVLVLSFDALQREPVRLLQRVAEFLGVDPQWYDEKRVSTDRVYPSRSDDVPAFADAYVAWRWLPATRRLNDELGGELDPWIADMESRARRVGWLTRALFHLARRVAWVSHTTKRRRLARQFRRNDARLRAMITGGSD